MGRTPCYFRVHRDDNIDTHQCNLKALFVLTVRRHNERKLLGPGLSGLAGARFLALNDGRVLACIPGSMTALVAIREDILLSEFAKENAGERIQESGQQDKANANQGNQRVLFSNHLRKHSPSSLWREKTLETKSCLN